MPKTIWKIKRRRNLVGFFFFKRSYLFDMLVIVAILAYFGEFWPKLNEASFYERKKE